MPVSVRQDGLWSERRRRPMRGHIRGQSGPAAFSVGARAVSQPSSMPVSVRQDGLCSERHLSTASATGYVTLTSKPSRQPPRRPRRRSPPTPAPRAAMASLPSKGASAGAICATTTIGTRLWDYFLRQNCSSKHSCIVHGYKTHIQKGLLRRFGGRTRTPRPRGLGARNPASVSCVPASALY